MQYLHKKQYYEDPYNLITIKECLRVIDTFKEIYKDSKNDARVKGVSEEDRIKTFNHLLHWKLLTVKGEKYRHKSFCQSKFVTCSVTVYKISSIFSSQL